MRRFLIGFGESISAIGVTIAAICLLTIVAINGANVAARYVFHAPFSWAEEAMVYITIASVFWGAIAVAWREIDIRIDAFVDWTGDRWRGPLRIAATIISISILSWLGFVSVRFTSQIYAFDLRSTALNLPMWIPNAMFASGVLLIILTTIARLLAPAAPVKSDPASGIGG